MMETEKQRKYVYSKKLLDNLNLVLNHIRDNRQDLLNATKTLIQSIEEPNRITGKDFKELKQENLFLEQSRNRIEQENIRLQEEYRKEMERNENLEEINRKILEILKKFQNKLSKMPKDVSNDCKENEKINYNGAGGEEQQFKFLNDLLNSVLTLNSITKTTITTTTNGSSSDSTTVVDDTNSIMQQPQQRLSLKPQSIQPQQQVSINLNNTIVEKSSSSSSSDKNDDHPLLLSSSSSKPTVSSSVSGDGDVCGESDKKNNDHKIAVTDSKKRPSYLNRLEKEKQKQLQLLNSPKLHKFKTVKNMTSFFKCSSCDKSIMPFDSYAQCTECYVRLHKKCHELNTSRYCNRNDFTIIGDCNADCIKFNQNSIDLFKECLKQVQTRGIDKRRLYMIIEKIDKDHKIRDKVGKILKKYQLKNEDLEGLKLNKLDVNIICSLIATLLQRFEDSLIPSHLWNDFVRACDQKSLNDKIELFQQLVENQMNSLQQNGLALLIAHLNFVLTRNHCNQLNKKTVINLFARFLIRKCSNFGSIDIGIASPYNNNTTILNQKYEQIKILNLQKEILQTLMDIDRKFWEEILERKSKGKFCIDTMASNEQMPDSKALNPIENQSDDHHQQQNQEHFTSFVEKNGNSAI